MKCIEFAEFSVRPQPGVWRARGRRPGGGGCCSWAVADTLAVMQLDLVSILHTWWVGLKGQGGLGCGAEASRHPQLSFSWTG